MAVGDVARAGPEAAEYLSGSESCFSPRQSMFRIRLLDRLAHERAHAGPTAGRLIPKPL